MVGSTGYLVAILAVTGAVMGCRGCRGQPTEAPRSVVIGREDIARATWERIETGPRISGSLEARQQSVVRAKVPGSVLRVHAEIGQAVRRGQILARIESRTLQEAVDAARAAVRAATTKRDVAAKELDRTRALVAGGAVAERDLDTARSASVAAKNELATARSQLASARVKLSDATVRAPITGVVSRRPVNQGDVVTAGNELFTVVDPSSMRLAASVPPAALDVVTTGAPVHFQVRGYPGRTFTGTITRIAPAADEVTRQVAILVDIPNPGGDLVGGLFADGRVVASAYEGLVIPTIALLSGASPPAVARVKGGVVEHVTVSLGLRDDESGKIAVTFGLERGDVVLVHGARDIAPGTAVVLPSPAAPAIDAGEAREKTAGAR